VLTIAVRRLVLGIASTRASSLSAGSSVEGAKISSGASGGEYVLGWTTLVDEGTQITALRIKFASAKESRNAWRETATYVDLKNRNVEEADRESVRISLCDINITWETVYSVAYSAVILFPKLVFSSSNNIL
jgi:hypothetical protein